MGNNPTRIVTPSRSHQITVRPRLSVVEDLDASKPVTINVEEPKVSTNVYPTSILFNEEEKQTTSIADDRTIDQRVRALLRQVCVCVLFALQKKR